MINVDKHLQYLLIRPYDTSSTSIIWKTLECYMALQPYTRTN